MKKQIFFAALVCSLLAVQTAVAQNPVTTLEHNGTTQVFYGLNSLVDAYEASVNGDSLYLSTGYFTAPASIAKRINIIGAGHFPDSLNVAKRTNLLVINGAINLRYGADSLRLEGLYINGGISFNNYVDYVNVVRCWTTNVDFDNSSINNNNNCTFEECFIQGVVNKHKGINLCIKNSIINHIINIDANALITNNIIFGRFWYVNTSVIQNNIFFDNYALANEDENGHIINDNKNNIINNNVFASYTNSIIYNLISNNYISVVLSNLFVNQTGNSINYAHDYHLKTPETYIGTDGTQVGLYGGEIPFKDKGFPSNPQIITKKIASKTDSNGNLQINFTVKTQDN
ncbi:MAG: hypothetical protein WCK78_13215 [Paludibacter sp.]